MDASLGHSIEPGLACYRGPMATYVEQSLTKLKEFEGCVPWMYLDTAGRVTVGIGMMLADAEAAAELPFVLGGVAAGRSEAVAEFGRVSAMTRGLLPGAYRRDGGPELAEATMEGHLRATLMGFEADLRRRLAGYDGLPDPAKIALLDMAYNLGPGGLLEGYPKMLAAVAAGAWAVAAAECLRHGISAERNAWTRLELLSAAATTAVAKAIRAVAARPSRLLPWAGAVAIGGALVWVAVRRWTRGR